MKVDSGLNYQNVAYAYESLKTKNSLNNKTKENENSGLYFNFNQNYASEFGFRIDDNGFFEKELNKLANIPNNYDINIKSIRLITKEIASKQDNINYAHVDLPQLLNKYHNALSAVNDEFNSNDESLFNRSQINSLAQGFSTSNGDFMGDIQRIYNNKNELNKVLEKQNSLNTLMLDNKIINFHFDKAVNDTSNNEILKPYLNKSGQISKSGLLMNFIYQDIKEANKNELSFLSEYNGHEKLYKILQGEEDIEEYVKKNNEEQMSFDLYLYVNSVDKNSASKEQLSSLYNQYLAYSKDLDIKEFADSSSTYQIYINGVKSEFKSLKDEYNAQDKEKLEQISLQRQNAQEKFIYRRQRQASVGKVLKAYYSVMR
ncbi:hypothetical protein FMM58_07775 [Campylobacter sp. LR291e]|uniref:hypothetical protein n=1 Tax=unclassified Campylobacter TaxID=2593542 RepID=UPI001237DB77|nr:MULTISPECIES: hypothetical protein [unclassified Campylobacter]KAA6227841.1 hypothetical protein FMM54_01540 [Campylobacter sp. LR185c]KAA6228249.1 hypothetical protein FMM55_01345 [Campylobacter sp. LR196d]KAA6229249.1 hypothetical protein FMM58_07775 [Campylobacter sp. LR291e]KAA8604471.1 hypothetical protein CGP82_02815 [Campylobacter sp. LR185c]